MDELQAKLEEAARVIMKSAISELDRQGMGDVATLVGLNFTINRPKVADNLFRIDRDNGVTEEVDKKEEAVLFEARCHFNQFGQLVCPIRPKP